MLAREYFTALTRFVSEIEENGKNIHFRWLIAENLPKHIINYHRLKALLEMHMKLK